MENARLVPEAGEIQFELRLRKDLGSAVHDHGWDDEPSLFVPIKFQHMLRYDHDAT